MVTLVGIVALGLQSKPPESDFAVGADFSFLFQAEQRGTQFKDNGIVKPGLQIFKDHGYNWIRLRLFVNPTDLPNNLAYTIEAAKQAKKLGYKFLLCYHLSDTWADPAHQIMPKAWEGLDHKGLVAKVYEYTKETITEFKNQGVMPDMVQVGNEIRVGMMWPNGKLPENWDSFAEFERSGIKGVMDASDSKKKPKIMVHIDSGGDMQTTKWWFDNFHRYKIKYDVIGQSYYPWWHGSLLNLRDNLNFMAKTYKKEIMVVEAAYNWRPGEYLNKPGPYPESPEGQRQYLDELMRAVLDTPDNLGKGVMWWEPAVTGPLRRRGMFGDDGNALPVITVFDKWRRW